MKAVKLIIKILAALVAIAGVVYVVATYGDKIVAWAKKLLARTPCCEGECERCDCECFEADEESLEEAAPAEVTADAEEETVVASDADFEG